MEIQERNSGAADGLGKQSYVAPKLVHLLDIAKDTKTESSAPANDGVVTYKSGS